MESGEIKAINSTIMESELPLHKLSGHQQCILGLKEYKGSSMIPQLILPIWENENTQVVNIFAKPKSKIIDIQVVFLGCGQDKKANTTRGQENRSSQTDISLFPIREKMLIITDPVMPYDDASKYKLESKHVVGELLMTGPKLPVVQDEYQDIPQSRKVE